jgi:hypothetical protein
MKMNERKMSAPGEGGRLADKRTLSVLLSLYQ